ncbi:MAG: ATP-binding protein [Patescibacteria group bacterium]
MNLFLFISALINGSAALIAGGLVYFQKKHNLVHQTFAVFCFALAFWAFGSFWPIATQDAELSLLSFRILHVGAFFLAIANFHFVSALLGTVDKQKLLIRLGYASAILLLPLIGTNFFITGVGPIDDFAFWLRPGILYHVWIVIWLAYFGLTFHALGVSYKKSEGLKKQQIKYIYLGEIVSFAALVMNFLPAYGLEVPIYFNILLTGQIGAFAYTILRFRHLDVQLSILGIVQKVVSLVIALGLGLGTSYVVFFRQEQPPVLLLFPIISLATYFALSGFFSSRSFYRMLGMRHVDDFTKAIEDFYERKLFYKNFEELSNSVHTIFVQNLGISSAAVTLLSSKNETTFAPLTDYFDKFHEEYLLLTEFFPEKDGDFDALLKLGAICLPLHGEHGRLIGFFFLGHKPRQNTYTQKELQILKAAATHISLSLKILNYNADLQKEVARKTQQLKIQAGKLEVSYQKLQKADAEKDMFFSMTSHDLRTPLTIIKGYDDFLLSEKFGKLTDKQKEFLGRIAASTENMLWLVNSILDLSKLNAGRMEFNLAEMDWLEAATGIVSDFKIKCAEKSIELNFEHAENLPTKITTDGEKIKRVWMNLLMNAFKFTPEKGKIFLRVKADEQAGFLRFEVEDTGVGIPKESFKLVFDEFRQFHNSEQKGGTGLGLAIVKKVVERLGGKIWFESEVNRGSNFIFTIPINPQK